MRRSYRYLHLDVFTRELFGGNQLAVFLDARGLTDAEMQAVAFEMNFSESTFILPPTDPACAMRVRIMTPQRELPMAGHPTIGTAFALARAGVLSPSDARVVFELGVGPTPVDLTWEQGALRFARMSQLRPIFEEPALDREALARALRVPTGALHPALPVQTVSCGVPYLLVPLATRADVDRAGLDLDAYDRIRPHSDLEPLPVYVFSTQAGPDAATTYSRMFAVGLGMVEDPATGSAAGPLGCYLVRHGVVNVANAATIVNLQGVRMGRPSVIHVAVTAIDGTITAVHVGGEAIVAGEGTLYV